MRSTISNLESRGFINPESISLPDKTPTEDFIPGLSSQIACDRTTAAILIEKSLMYQTQTKFSNSKSIPSEKLILALIDALQAESKLYPKIAISNALIACGENAIPFLIPRLGSIGKNQHNTLPSKAFKKKSYPLPRDIVARILVHLSTPVLESIIKAIVSLSDKQIREAIDVIGHISFYSGDTTTLPILKQLYYGKSEDSIIRWKTIRAFSAFNDPEVLNLLSEIIENQKEEAFIWEAKRSLDILSEKKD